MVVVVVVVVVVVSFAASFACVDGCLSLDGGGFVVVSWLVWYFVVCARC